MSLEKRVLVAMSGGVDSSVAAFLMKEEGYEVIGVTMMIWGGEGPRTERGRHACYGPGEEEDIDDARRIAERLDIPFHVFDLRKHYRASVLDYTCHEYISGRTPNPCIRCNQRVKLGALVEKVRDSRIVFERVATGHYASVKYDRKRGRHLLMKGRDLKKDQSYSLYSLSQDQLGICVFPLGDYLKQEVIKEASDAGLDVTCKTVSQDFMAGGYYRLFKATAQPGPIVDLRGRTVGEHRGIPFYAIGQRRGLNLRSNEPLYVISLDPVRHTVIVGVRERLYRIGCTAARLNWISIERLEEPMSVKAKIRYSHNEAEAVITPHKGDRVHVRFSEPQMAITPGQAVVFYAGDLLVGGGTID